MSEIDFSKWTLYEDVSQREMQLKHGNLTATVKTDGTLGAEVVPWVESVLWTVYDGADYNDFGYAATFGKALSAARAALFYAVQMQEIKPPVCQIHCNRKWHIVDANNERVVFELKVRDVIATLEKRPDGTAYYYIQQPGINIDGSLPNVDLAACLAERAILMVDGYQASVRAMSDES